MVPGEVHQPRRTQQHSGALTGLDALQARRSHAFAVGEASALERNVSADAYLFLYKELVRLCKDGTRCWPGLAWLVERLGASEGTVKRWLAELVNAGLIRRTARAGGLTTLTTVVALEAFDAAGAARDTPTIRADTDSRQVRDATEPDVFFLPGRERISGRSGGSFSISHTNKKNQKPNGGGGTHASQLDITQAAALLQQQGVLAPAVLDELKHVPIDAIERCFAVARSRPHVVDAPGFAVALLRRAAARSEGRPQRRSPITQYNPTEAAPAHVEHGHASASGRTQPAILGGIWQQVLDRLRASIDATAFETWCVDTTLEVLDTVAVVGVATCFQRDTVERQFGSHIADALAASTGQFRELRFVIRP